MILRELASAGIVIIIVIALLVSGDSDEDCSTVVCMFCEATEIDCGKDDEQERQD